MTKNPLINALSASAYIVLVAMIMFYAPKVIGPGPDKSVFIPIAVVSLFTLSAAVMGFIFLLQPAQLYLDGKKKIAVSLFLQTVAYFAGITLIVFILLFSGVIK